METNGELSQVPEINEQLDNKSTCTTCLQALGHFIKKTIVFKGIKILGFIVLLISVMLLYGLDIYTKFQDQATTFKTKSHEANNFNMPPVTFCMGNGLKPTVMKKYGIESIFEFTFGSKVVMNMASVWDVFVEAAYIINRDFQIIAFMLDPISKARGSITLLKGHNYHKGKEEGAGYDFNVTEYHTNLAGTCYQINSNFPLPPPNWIGLKLVFNESLGKTDIPQVNIMYTHTANYFCKTKTFVNALLLDLSYTGNWC